MYYIDFDCGFIRPEISFSIINLSCYGTINNKQWKSVLYSVVSKELKKKEIRSKEKVRTVMRKMFQVYTKKDCSNK